MTKKEAIKKLKKIQKSSDVERAHVDADVILCELLEQFGYADVVRQYEKVSKWYS
jgi:hypothetical protein